MPLNKKKFRLYIQHYPNKNLKYCAVKGYHPSGWEEQTFVSLRPWNTTDAMSSFFIRSN